MFQRKVTRDVVGQLGLEIKHFDPLVVTQLNSTLEEQHKTPKQKYDEPMTTQQEIGWWEMSFRCKHVDSAVVAG